MLRYLTETYGSMYCLHRPHGTGEAFGLRDDGRPAEPAPAAIKATTVIALCSVALMAGLVLSI